MNGGGSGGRGGVVARTTLGKILLFVSAVLRVIVWPLRRLSGVFFPPGPFDDISNSESGDAAARAFAAFFRKAYTLGPQREHRNDDGHDGTISAGGGSSLGMPGETENVTDCPFVGRRYDVALSRAAAEASSNTSSPRRSLVLVYLHSPLHGNADSFARSVLSDPNILHYLNTDPSLSCFGASIHTADGLRVAEMLNVVSYPFIALLHATPISNDSRNRNATSPTLSLQATLLFRAEGPTLLSLSPRDLLRNMQTAITIHRDAEAAQDAHRAAIAEDAMLRRAQDEEYQQALEADRRRERERLEATRRAQLEAERAKEEEQRKEHLEQERLRHARQLAGTEPPKANPSDASYTITRLRFTLPTGSKIDRRFKSTDTIDSLRAFLTVYFHDHDIPIVNIALSSNFPKRTFDDGSMTLQQADLVPQAVIMIQNLDS